LLDHLTSYKMLMKHSWESS